MKELRVYIVVGFFILIFTVTISGVKRRINNLSNTVNTMIEVERALAETMLILTTDIKQELQREKTSWDMMLNL